MSKQTGLGWTAWSVDDSGGTLRDIRRPTTSLQIAMPRGVQDATGIDQSAFERLLLLSDLSGTMTGVFDDGTNSVHDVLKSVPTASAGREFLYTVSGNSLGVTNTPTIHVTDYQLNRQQSGEFLWSAPFVLANGVVPEWSAA
jgi:hypothetical protein